MYVGTPTSIATLTLQSVTITLSKASTKASMRASYDKKYNSYTGYITNSSFLGYTMHSSYAYL